MDITVTDALLIGRPDASNTWALSVEVTPDTGPMRRIAVYAPEDTMECRAAEYGIDPTDRDTLLEIMLYEPHLPDAASAHEHPQSLFNALTVDEARAWLLRRVATGKGTGKLGTRNRRPNETRPAQGRILVDSDKDPATPLAVIRRESPIDAEIVAVRAAHTATVRDRIRVTRQHGPLSDADLRRRPTPEQVQETLQPKHPNIDPGRGSGRN